MDGVGNHDLQQTNAGTEKEIWHGLIYKWELMMRIHGHIGRTIHPGAYWWTEGGTGSGKITSGYQAMK